MWDDVKMGIQPKALLNQSKNSHNRERKQLFIP